MKSNPFLSPTFTSFWFKHFNKGVPGIYFKGIHDLSFIKHPLAPIYFNTGKTHTKGMSYSLDNFDARQLGHKVILIYDLHGGKVRSSEDHSGVGRYIVKQYPGFYIDLDDFKNLDDLLTRHFSKSSRYKFRKYKSRLEASFDIRYEMYHGFIEYEEYQEIFKSFHGLLQKRFDEKGITNNNLNPEEWNFYKDVVYPMILEKKAALFVVYHGTRPIAISLQYLAGNWLVDAIRTFDTDFSKFHLGTVSMMAQIEWCLENKIGALDFSKGYFNYKEHWSTHSYSFEYHLLYNPGSIISRAMAYLLNTYFMVKQQLRDKKLHEKFHKITYLWKSKAKTRGITKYTPYSIVEKDQFMNTGEFLEIDVRRPEYQVLRTILYEVLYLNGGTYETTKIYALDDSQVTFVITNNITAWEIELFQN